MWINCGRIIRLINMFVPYYDIKYYIKVRFCLPVISETGSTMFSLWKYQVSRRLASRRLVIRWNYRREGSWERSAGRCTSVLSLHLIFPPASSTASSLLICAASEPSRSDAAGRILFAELRKVNSVSLRTWKPCWRKTRNQRKRFWRLCQEAQTHTRDSQFFQIFFFFFHLFGI